MKTLTFASLSFNTNNTPISTQFDDIYFSNQDGLNESIYVFQEGNQLLERWQIHPYSHFVIAETGFGTGLNFFAVVQKFRQFRADFPHAKLQRLYFISFEKYPLTSEQLVSVHQSYPEFADISAQLTAYWQPRQVGCERYHFDNITLDLWFGEMAENLVQLGDYHNQQVDCWFLDGFSPDKNPEMWSEHLYQQMFRLTRNGGSFATFTAASTVRRGLEAAGFEVKKRKGFGKKREMLFGLKLQENVQKTLKYPYFFQQNQTTNENIALIGGGISSFFTALSLIERGKKVTLYCKDAQLADNASGNLQGAIYPQLSDDDQRNVRFYLHSFDYALQRITQLKSHISFEHELSGVGLCAYNDRNEQKLRKLCEQFSPSLIEWQENEQFSCTMGIPLSQGGAFIRQGGWLSPQQLVNNGFAYLQQRGLNIVLNHHVENITWNGTQWQWHLHGIRYCHDTVVLANGHLVTQFVQTEGIPLYPVRGQVSHIPSTPSLHHLNSVLCYDGYLTPRSAAGLHCVGASHIRDNQDTYFSLDEHQQNFAKLQQNLTACGWTSELDFSQNQGKVGIRSAFRDRMPMVGAVPNYNAQEAQYPNLYNQLRKKMQIEPAICQPNLYLITGLGSRGLTTSPLLGEILASQICREPLPISEELWQVITTNRSWIRNWLKGRK